MAPRGKKHGGILIRGATGDLWFLRDDRVRPLKARHPELKKKFDAFARRHPSKGDVGKDLPEDILDILDDLFGPLIGAWWIWGLRLRK